MSTLLGKTLKRVVPASWKSMIASKVMRAIGKPEYPVDLASYAQAGEDAVLRFLFKDYSLDLRDVTYLDIGVRHPVFGSNTFLFYCAGSHGVCVDADDTFLPLVRRLRTRDTVLNVAISDGADGEATFYFIEGGASTLDAAEAAERERRGARVETRRVPMIGINRLITENFERCPTLLSIDIEGMDLPVLMSLDFTAHPVPVICVETCRYSETRVRPKDPTIAAFLATKGYEPYADTYVNTIFVDRKWFYRGMS